MREIEVLSTTLGAAPLIVSLLITPIATELPEKFNSILWIRHRKDTLALGNITGAMVFQSTFPVSIGLIFTDLAAGHPERWSPACWRCSAGRCSTSRCA